MKLDPYPTYICVKLVFLFFWTCVILAIYFIFRNAGMNNPVRFPDPTRAVLPVYAELYHDKYIVYKDK